MPNNCVIHDFYCLKCGKAGLPLSRKVGKQKASLHRKKLYCFWCKEEVNHIEIKNQWELEEFRENYKNGVYKNECEESLHHCRCSRKW